MRAFFLALPLSLGLLAAAVAPVSAQAPLPAVPAAPAAFDTYNVVASDSKIGYLVVHPLHKVNGQSKAVSGRARLSAAGQAQVMVSAGIESFDSGNANRDAHVKEVLEAARYPKVEIKALTDGLTAPASFPASVDKTFKVQVSFHGVNQTLDVPVKVTFESAQRVRAQCSFQLSLEAFKVERPSLMFKKVDDALKIDADVVFGK
jgi:polyisoprenoid-binding protein YceI